MTKLRTLEIVDFLNECKYCSIHDLMTRFKISPATVRRDIAELLAAGKIRKVHGGVAALETAGTPVLRGESASRYQERLANHASEKIGIAVQAADLVNSGDTIFLDSSTTAYYLAAELRKRSFSSLTLVTNSVLIMQEFSQFDPGCFLIGLGGNYDLQLNAFLGQATLRELGNLTIEKAFISAVGLNANGITSRHENLAVFLSALIRRSEQTILLLDSSKFGKAGNFPVAPRNALHTILSDAPVPQF